MAKFLTTVGNSYSIEEIIINSNEILTFVTPYLKLSNNLIERIQDADKRGVKITLIYGKSELINSEKDHINKLKNINVYFYKNLHAKCYFNENDMIITSMNLYEFSERNNREMGISLNKDQDTILYNEAIREVKSIVNTSTLENNSNVRVEKLDETQMCKLHSDYKEQYDFYLPSLMAIFKFRYPKYNVKMDEGFLIIEDFPKKGIELELRGIATFHFENEYTYNRIKNSLRYKIDELLPDIRIYWNYLKVMIYQEKGYKEDISSKGLIDITARYKKIVDVFYKELK